MIKNEIRNIAYSIGCDVCGFADVACFSGAPEGHRPTDIWDKCKSVIVIGYAMPKGALLTKNRLVYSRFNPLTADIVDRLEMNLAKRIEKFTGMNCVPLPCDMPYDDYNPDTLTGIGELSMKHAAVLAGLGQLGKNTIFLNAEFGNRLSLGAILTDIEIESDPPAESICIKGCHRCVDACPARAIENGHVSQTKCRPNSYITNLRGFDITDCHACRDVCPMKLGLQGVKKV